MKKTTKSQSGRSRTASKSATKSKSSGSGRSASSRNAAPKGRTASKSASGSKSSKAPAAAKSRKPAMTSREGLEKVFKDCLKDIYYAEKQIVKALKKMAKASSNEELIDAFNNHREETETQIERLNEAFESLGMRPQGKKCEAMDGLVKEGDEHIEEFEKGPARDAALIVGAQKVEHYEIAAYGSLKTFAALLGYEDCEEIFDEILEQEKNTDDILNQVAEAVNQEAYGEDEEDEEDEETEYEEEDEEDENEEAEGEEEDEEM